MRVSFVSSAVFLRRPWGEQEKKLCIGERADCVVLPGLEIDECGRVALDGFERARDRDATADDFDHCPLVDGVVTHLFAGAEINDDGSAFGLGKEYAWLRPPDRRHSGCIGPGFALVLLVGRRCERR